MLLFSDVQSVTLCLTAGVWLDDEGLYICEARNQFGTSKTEARVSVTGLGMLVKALIFFLPFFTLPFSCFITYLCLNTRFSCRTPCLGPCCPNHYHWYWPVPEYSLHATGWYTSARKTLVPKWKTCKTCI